MLKAFPQLEELNLSSCRNITNQSVVSWFLTAAQPQGHTPRGKQSLGLTSSGGNTTPLVSPLMSPLTRSRSPPPASELVRRRDIGIQYREFPLLVSLGLAALNGINDEGMAVVARCCPNLTNLDISHNTTIMDPSLMHVATHCRALRILHLKGCRGITDIGELPGGFKSSF